MPEGDALYRFANLLRPALQDQRIVAARTQGPGPVPRIEKIVGATCLQVYAVGKNLIIEFDNALAIRGHLRMYGTWHVYAHGEPWRKRQASARLVLETEGAVVVNFDAPVVELMPVRALEHHVPLAGLGPNLLDDDFDAGQAFLRFRDPLLAGTTIGDAIMDQKLMAGVGNIWKHETLFRCAINPWRSVASLSDDQLRELIATAQSLLRASVGKTNAIGLRERPRMHVYKRTGQLCFRCGTRLRAAPQGNDVRHTTWCPRCQPLAPGQPEPRGRNRAPAVR
jgi:endonuclease-8